MCVCSSNGIELTPSISIPLRGVVYFCQNMSKAVPVVAMAVRAPKIESIKVFLRGVVDRLSGETPSIIPRGTKEVKHGITELLGRLHTAFRDARRMGFRGRLVR